MLDGGLQAVQHVRPALDLLAVAGRAALVQGPGLLRGDDARPPVGQGLETQINARLGAGGGPKKGDVPGVGALHANGELGAVILPGPDHGPTGLHPPGAPRDEVAGHPQRVDDGLMDLGHGTPNDRFDTHAQRHADALPKSRTDHLPETTGNNSKSARWQSGRAKVRRSRQATPILAEVVEELQRHKLVQDDVERLGWKAEHDRDFVFTNYNGSPLVSNLTCDRGCSENVRTIDKMRHQFLFILAVIVLSSGLGWLGREAAPPGCVPSGTNLRSVITEPEPVCWENIPKNRSVVPYTLKYGRPLKNGEGFVMRGTLSLRVITDQCVPK